MKKLNQSVISVALLSFLLVGMAFLLSGCGIISQDPEAKISVTSHSVSNGTVSVKKGETLNFDGTNSEPNGGEIIDYDWDFKSNKSATATSTKEKPSYTYDSTGTYTVTLTVTDDSTNSNSTSITVEVSEEEFSASFTMSPNPAKDDEKVDLSSTSTGDLDSYTWYFGDQSNVIQSGSSVTEVPDVTIDLQTPSFQTDSIQSGSYVVGLTISNTDTDPVEVSGRAKTLIVEESSS